MAAQQSQQDGFFDLLTEASTGTAAYMNQLREKYDARGSLSDSEGDESDAMPYEFGIDPLRAQRGVKRVHEVQEVHEVHEALQMVVTDTASDTVETMAQTLTTAAVRSGTKKRSQTTLTSSVRFSLQPNMNWMSVFGSCEEFLTLIKILMTVTGKGSCALTVGTENGVPGIRTFTHNTAHTAIVLAKISCQVEFPVDASNDPDVDMEKTICVTPSVLVPFFHLLGASPYLKMYMLNNEASPKLHFDFQTAVGGKGSVSFPILDDEDNKAHFMDFQIRFKGVMRVSLLNQLLQAGVKSQKVDHLQISLYDIPPALQQPGHHSKCFVISLVSAEINLDLCFPYTVQDEDADGESEEPAEVALEAENDDMPNLSNLNRTFSGAYNLEQVADFCKHLKDVYQLNFLITTKDFLILSVPVSKDSFIKIIVGQVVEDDA